MQPNGETMYSIWIQVNPTTWVEAEQRFVEELDATHHALMLMHALPGVRVFVQFGSDIDMQEVIQ